MPGRKCDFCGAALPEVPRVIVTAPVGAAGTAGFGEQRELACEVLTVNDPRAFDPLVAELGKIADACSAECAEAGLGRLGYRLKWRTND